jgi:uncharacterized membrane-anchored protein YjiN (DUF445 family)
MADVNLDTNIDTKVEDTKIDESKVDDTKVDEPKTLTMTQEELDALITKRLERASKKAETEKAEAEKLAKMSEAERQQALFDKEKTMFAEERKQYQKEKMELEVIKQMSSKGLPTEFSAYLLAEDAETALNNIKTFEVKWQQAIEKAVDNKLKGVTPKTGGTVTGITKEDFNKMGYQEKMKIFNESPELYKELSK